MAVTKLVRRIAEAAAILPKGVWRFLGKNHTGMVVGFKGKAGAGRVYAFPTGGYGYYLAGMVPLP